MDISRSRRVTLTRPLFDIRKGHENIEKEEIFDLARKDRLTPLVEKKKLSRPLSQSLPPYDHSSSNSVEDLPRLDRRRSVSLCYSQNSLLPKNERSQSSEDLISSATKTLLMRQRRLSASNILGSDSSWRTKQQREMLTSELQKPDLFRRASLPPISPLLDSLSSSNRQKHSNVQLTDKFYRRWRNKGRRKTMIDDEIQEENSKEEKRLSMQQNVHFSPEFEQVFRDFSVDE